MIVCLCNNFNEEAISKMTYNDYLKVKKCGACNDCVKKLLTESHKGVNLLDNTGSNIEKEKVK